jgi:DNA polymerase elongation subunit (family B)
VRLIAAEQAEPSLVPAVRLPAFAPKITSIEDSILDFDIETVAAGFADPDWVPQKITCVAWSWIGEDKVESRVCGPTGIFGDPSLRARMLEPLLAEIEKADVLTGHNIIRFDLPIVNAECMRLGLEPIRRTRVQDTMLLVRSKGFKKGQDNLASLFHAPEQKMNLNWQEWQDAYDEDGWGTIRKRCESDVISHKQIREKLVALGLVKTVRYWNG